jgi:hypothetical protein
MTLGNLFVFPFHSFLRERHSRLRLSYRLCKKQSQNQLSHCDFQAKTEIIIPLIITTTVFSADVNHRQMEY